MKVCSLTVIVIMLLLACETATQEIKSTAIDLAELQIAEIQEAYSNGNYSIEELVQAYLDRIAEIDQNGPALNSVREINPDALEIARKLDQELTDGKSRGPLHGIPILLKDNVDTDDKMHTTAGARIMRNSKPLQDAFIVQKLRASGVVILGKANLSEWANFHSTYSSSGWSGLGGQVKNPYVLSRNPCGSSSGSGVSVSANLTVLAIGTETNGSIVCPSNNNGIVGIKPTVGLLSRSGIVPISFTQDTPGPMARSVTDAVICLGAMTGVDEADGKTTASVGKSHTDYTQFLEMNGLQGKRIGVFRNNLGRFFRVEGVFNQAIKEMEEGGATFIEIETISEENINAPSFQVLLYEFKDGLNKYFAALGEKAPVKNMDELIEQTFSDSVEMQYFDHALLKQANEKSDLTSQEYLDALENMQRFTREEGIDRVMDENNLDAIISPTGGAAWKTDLINGDRFGYFSSSPAAIAGYPAITVPMGALDGMPLGISFYGRAWSEPVLIAIAYAYEQRTRHRRAPEFRSE